MSWTQSKILSTLPGVVHGFADRTVNGDTTDIAMMFGIPGGIARLTQVHSGDIIVVRRSMAEVENQPEGDALITGVRGIGIAVSTADCVPVLLADEKGTVVAAVHAGWRGTFSGIVESTLRAIAEGYGVEPSRMKAAIGPSIKSCCYEVGEDVASLFMARLDDWGGYLSERGGSKYILDLASANLSALRREGVSDVEIIDVCTRCDEDFYSYRREGTGVGSQFSFIALI